MVRQRDDGKYLLIFQLKNNSLQVFAIFHDTRIIYLTSGSTNYFKLQISQAAQHPTFQRWSQSVCPRLPAECMSCGTAGVTESLTCIKVGVKTFLQSCILSPSQLRIPHHLAVCGVSGVDCCCSTIFHVSMINVLVNTWPHWPWNCKVITFLHMTKYLKSHNCNGAVLSTAIYHFLFIFQTRYFKALSNCTSNWIWMCSRCVNLRLNISHIKVMPFLAPCS